MATNHQHKYIHTGKWHLSATLGTQTSVHLTAACTSEPAPVIWMNNASDVQYIIIITCNVSPPAVQPAVAANVPSTWGALCAGSDKAAQKDPFLDCHPGRSSILHLTPACCGTQGMHLRTWPKYDALLSSFCTHSERA